MNTPDILPAKTMLFGSLGTLCWTIIDLFKQVNITSDDIWRVLILNAIGVTFVVIYSLVLKGLVDFVINKIKLKVNSGRKEMTRRAKEERKTSLIGGMLCLAGLVGLILPLFIVTKIAYSIQFAILFLGLIVLGIWLIFSKDTLFTSLNNLLSKLISVMSFNKKSNVEEGNKEDNLPIS